jgi:hypothetical protein
MSRPADLDAGLDAEPVDPVTLIGLLAEPERLRAFAAVVVGATSADDVARISGLDGAAARRALERLSARGLVRTAPDGGLVAHEQAFKAAARAAAAAKVVEEDDFGDVPPADAAVLRSFVKEGRLVRIPAQKGKRRVILNWISTRFEPGVRYEERVVSDMLAEIHADYASLRRYLIDEEFLERGDGHYWRSGGTFEV